MRKCDNCYNGHYNLSDIGEEIYCDINEFQEDYVLSEQSCEYHRYIDGMSEERNYVFYDDSYLGPGYFIINKQGEDIVKFFKLYVDYSREGFPSYCLRAFSIYGRDNPDNMFNSICFSFRDREDNENGLYDIFTKFCLSITDKIETINKFEQGKNMIGVNTNGKVTRFIVSKDIYGVKYPSDFIDINMGDYYSCKSYEKIASLFNDLNKLDVSKIEDNEIKRLLRVKLK